MKKIIFIQLNEINFDLVKQYIKFNNLPNFEKLFNHYKNFETLGEDKYEALEPWIQWVSIQTGQSLSEHGVFRLGDAVNMPDNICQLYEILENKGLKIGAISPMNARNRLKNPAYFIPDPWTDTPPDSSGFSRRLTNMLKQTVNDNAAGRISTQSILTLAESILKSFNITRTFGLFNLILKTVKKPWMKSLVLDHLIHLIHRHLFLKKQPDASFVFFNAGAHIQHHYYFNSKASDQNKLENPTWYIPKKADPILDMLLVYDKILGDYLALSQKGVKLIIATGLSQVPYDRVKYYYRLTNHENFIKKINLNYLKISPRMTRDFEIIFENELDKKNAIDKLKKIKLKRTGGLLFGEIEAREKSLFVTLSYPDEILPNDIAVIDDEFELNDFGHMVSFVAIKNGMHNTKGFAFVSPNTNINLPNQPVSVTTLFDLTLQIADEAV